jgi:hypothetical protein
MMSRSRWNENWQEKPKYSEKTCPSTKNATLFELGWNLGYRGGKPAANCLNYSMAIPKCRLEINNETELK